MSPFNPAKLHVRFVDVSEEVFAFPRKYILTHSDRTGDLFLTISSEFDFEQISHWYIKLMRDEVLGEWKSVGNKFQLHLNFHISGGLVFGWAKFRDRIIRSHLRLVFEAIRYGEKKLVQTNEYLDSSPIFAHFNSKRRKYNRIERFGILGDYKI